MADTFPIDAAVVTLLAADPTIASVAVDRVCRDVAPPGSSSYITVGRRVSDDEGVMSKPSTEIVELSVTAFVEDTSVTTANQLASRVHTLLENAPLSVDGYHVAACYRTQTLGPGAIVDGDRLWQRREQVFEVWAEPLV